MGVDYTGYVGYGVRIEPPKVPDDFDGCLSEYLDELELPPGVSFMETGARCYGGDGDFAIVVTSSKKRVPAHLTMIPTLPTEQTDEAPVLVMFAAEKAGLTVLEGPGWFAGIKIW